MFSLTLMSVLIALLSILLLILIVKILGWRRVVPTNVVHIVQQGKRTISYGVGKDGGNVYYEWPKWIPVYGVEVRSLPVSNFNVDLHDYAAYDKDRLPFIVDIKAFFRIEDTNKAAEKVESFDDMNKQLVDVVKGSVRSILAKESLTHIMEERSLFGSKFTDDVNKDLEHWGVIAIKNIELMDIRDAKGSQVIEQTMQKKMSAIDAESRIEIALNRKNAVESELQRTQEIEVQRAQMTQMTEEARAKSEQMIGIAQAESLKQNGISKEQALADIAEAAQKTALKEMEIIRTKQVVQAEIDKESKVVNAEAAQKIAIVEAESSRQASVIKAESDRIVMETAATANLVLKQKEAEGIKVAGLAEASIIKAKGESEAGAKQLMELALVAAQTTLAKEIGENKEYQLYLIDLKKIEASQIVGVKQAESLALALGGADLKLLVNSGDVHSGINKFGDLFSSKGASQLNSVLETLGQSDSGKQIGNLIKSFTDTNK